MVNRLFKCLYTFYLFPFDMAVNSLVNPSPTQCEDSSFLDHILPKTLQEGKDLEEDESFINLAVIMTNIAAGYDGEAKISESIFKHLDLYLSNLARHLFQESRLRLIIISDATLFHHLRTHLKMFLEKELSKRFKNDESFPILRLHIVDIAPMVDQNRDIIDQMKPLFSKTKDVFHPEDPRRKAFEEQLRREGWNPEELEGQIIEVVTDAVVKYSHDLFYIAPFYHETFPNLGHLIATDLDIEFRASVEELHEQFSLFSDSALMAAALDPTLRYKDAAREFLDLVSDNKILGHRKGDSLGLNQTVGNDGGDFLGLNTGVVLFNLTRMRESADYKKQLDAAAMRDIVYHFRFDGKGMLGDQDWLTLLSWKMPANFSPLSCAFNYVISMDNEEEIDLSSEAGCEGAKIIHRTLSIDNSF